MESITQTKEISNHGNSSKGISGSSLKIIAIICMLIDHIGASALVKVIWSDPSNFDSNGIIRFTPIVIVYFIMRGIGRIAFPIYIFLLVQGFGFTSNKWKYFLRLCLFGLVSEVPFDMAFCLTKEQLIAGELINFSYQNVFFTLAIGLLVLIFVDKIRGAGFSNKIIGILVELLVVAFGMIAAEILKTDYSYIGVLAIYVAYFVNQKELPEQEKRIKQMIFTCVALALAGWSELIALVDIVLIKKYNGQRGIDIKLLFYWFYPVHLLILGLIGLLIM